MTFGLRRAKVGLIVRAISFQDFQPCPDPPTSQTDRVTDGQTDDMQSQYRAWHYSASRGKTVHFKFFQRESE